MSVISESGRTLPRRLGGWSVVGLVIGITIGSGIFRTPASIAQRVSDPWWMLLVWSAGGLISLCGALSVAELAASLPRTGGWYLYLREGWGRAAGFLFGWSELVLIRASATGAIALVSSGYALRAAGIEAGETVVAVVAAALLVVAASVNIRGVRAGASVALTSTVAKFGTLAVLVCAALLFGGDHGGSVEHFARSSQPPSASGIGLALISVLWAYDGFADVSFAAGEVRDPQRILPRAIVGGTLAVLAIYLAANVAYLYMASTADIAASPLIAADVARMLAGDAGATAISAIVAISTFGALIGISLAAPRIFFAMAEDRLFFPAMARIHPRYQTPYVAIGLTAALGVLFVLTRTFEQLADTFVLSIWPFYGLAIAAIYRLRKTRPDLPRPYRVPGYPVVPAVFIGGVMFLAGSALIQNPLWTAVTFGIVLTGLPVYLVIRRKAPGYRPQAPGLGQG
jgi:basic amino acid/polyamine antiporter, APA family